MSRRQETVVIEEPLEGVVEVNSEAKEGVQSIPGVYNGPLFVRGQLNIDGAPANVPGLNFRAALCRCGQSKNKPFCDNSHDSAGFRDYGAVGESGELSTETGGPLAIKVVKDGPLLFKGNVTISGGSPASVRASQVCLRPSSCGP